MNAARLRDTRKIVVLRPNAVGDFMFCLPALHALKHAYPQAQLSLIGLPWHVAFLADRTGPVDRIITMPALRGMGSDAADGPDAGHFIDAMRREGFDLALQMYGGGRTANPLVAQFGARLSVGMRSADAAPLDRCIAYRGQVNRRLQLLEVAALAGARRWPLSAPLRATRSDQLLAAELIPESAAEKIVILQPGASDVRRCWPAARFAAVADALREEGAIVAINGSAAEAGLVGQVINAMHHRAIDLSGRASLGALCGLLARAALLISNDSGPLHMALEMGRPCVGIYWFTNLIESAPLCQDRHRAALSTRVQCPVCGQENIRTRCSHDVSFVDDITLEEVTGLAIDSYRAAS